MAEEQPEWGSREHAEQVINAGGSYMIGTKVYSSVASLPDKIEMTKNDPAKQQAAIADMQKQIEELQAKIAAAEPAKPTPPTK